MLETFRYLTVWGGYSDNYTPTRNSNFHPNLMQSLTLKDTNCSNIHKRPTKWTIVSIVSMLGNCRKSLSKFVAYWKSNYKEKILQDRTIRYWIMIFVIFVAKKYILCRSSFYCRKGTSSIFESGNPANFTSDARERSEILRKLNANLRLFICSLIFDLKWGEIVKIFYLNFFLAWSNQWRYSKNYIINNMIINIRCISNLFINNFILIVNRSLSVSY